MKIVYVSGPITGDGSPWSRHRNNMRGLEVARGINALMPGRLAAFSPHGNTLNMDGPGISWEQFLQMDLEIISRLDGVVMMLDWQYSRGARLEHDHAHSLGKPVFYWPLDRPALMRWAAGEAAPEGEGIKEDDRRHPINLSAGFGFDEFYYDGEGPVS